MIKIGNNVMDVISCIEESVKMCIGTCIISIWEQLEGLKAN